MREAAVWDEERRETEGGEMVSFDEQRKRWEKEDRWGGREKYSRPAGSSSGLNTVGKQSDQFSPQTEEIESRQ